jgi:glycosyltransferase involved in cell wall biosynthesis
MSQPKICIVIPAYNEEKRISPTLKAYTKYFDKHYPDQYYILVVVNGSSDQTDKVVENFAKTNSQVRLIVEKEKIGKGGAVILGLREAKAELVGFADADNSTEPDMMDKLYNYLFENKDYFAAIGSRYLPESEAGEKSKSRQFISWGRYMVVSIFFGLEIKDTQCGAQVMRKKGLDKVLDRMTLSDWSFDVDLLLSIRSEGHKIKEIGIKWEDKDGSNIEGRKIQASITSFLSLLRLRIFYSPFKFMYPVLEPFGRFIYNRLK